MGAYVFNNQIFDSWLNKKTDDIMSKVDRETISNEDMLILILKAQTNHFHHMDDEFRGEFSGIKKDLHEINGKFPPIYKTSESIEKRFESIDIRFEKIDQRFDRMEDKFRSTMMWQTGLMLTLFAGLYLKLYLP